MLEGHANMPLVSILIPVYNRRSLIGDCIRSALDQTYGNIEVIIVDNASTDGTWEVCQELAGTDDRVRLFRNEENIGPVRNWRRCADEARGEFVKVLFSDDLLLPRCVEEMVSPLDDPAVGLVYSPVFIGSSLSTSAIHYSNRNKLRLTADEFISRVLTGAAPVSPGAALIRSEDLRHFLGVPINSVRPQNYDRHGAGPDVMIALEAATKYGQVVNLPRPLVFFRAHPDSLSVRDENGEVRDSYVSAISYFLKSKASWRTWAGYVGVKWLHTIRQRRAWVNPMLFFRMHEGRGTLREIGCGAFFAIGSKLRAAVGMAR